MGILDTPTPRIVMHGTNANAPRPNVPCVLWIGTPQPVNMADGDIWNGPAA